MRMSGLVTIALGAALAALSGCGLASLDIEVSADGSGKVSFISMDLDSAALPIPEGVKGVTKSEHFRIAATGDELVFPDVRKFRMGGLDVKWNTRPGQPVTMLVTVDTRATAAWFKRLGITPQRLVESRARAKRFYETILKDAGMPGMGDPEKVVGQLGSMVNIGVKVKGGGKLKATLVKPAKLPPGWELSENEPGKAGFSIPADDLLASKVPSLTFSVAASKAPAPPTPAPAR
jgi:hypothetical protein